MAADEIIRPPENFALITPGRFVSFSASDLPLGVFRSAFPTEKNFTFMKTLKLKSVITLVPEGIPDSIVKFYEDEGITLAKFGVPGNKEPFVDIPDEKVCVCFV